MPKPTAGPETRCRPIVPAPARMPTLFVMPSGREIFIVRRPCPAPTPTRLLKKAVTAFFNQDSAPASTEEAHSSYAFAEAH